MSLKNVLGGHDALEVARYLLSRKNKDKDSVSKYMVFTPMKLIKMVYITHGWFMARYGADKPLIKEPIEAWKYGPVIQILHKKYKIYETFSNRSC